MSDLRTRIAAVIAAHGFAGYDPEDSYTNANWPCSCDWVGRTAPEYQQHVADAVIAELHPTRTCALCGRKGTQKFRAYRDGWVCQSIHACNRRKARR
jgi:hypothetical protein